MSIENIIFESSDTFEQTAIKTVLLNAGSSNLKKQMERLKINYSKIERGRKIIYVLRHKDFINEKVEVTL
jgi:actin-related protein